MKNRIVIAVDGSSASGKGTICQLLSQKFNIPHLNTGGLYRGLAYKAINLKIDFTNIEKLVELAITLDQDDISNPLIFTEEIGSQASIVSKIPEVRNALLKYQRDFANQEKGAILDGRDIGTVICPNADYKFFFVATPEERAKRRYKEMIEKKQSVKYEDILQQIIERDDRDKNRENSPFKKAEDAILIDTTDKDIQTVFNEVLSYIN